MSSLFLPFFYLSYHKLSEKGRKCICESVHFVQSILIYKFKPLSQNDSLSNVNQLFSFVFDKRLLMKSKPYNNLNISAQIKN